MNIPACVAVYLATLWDTSTTPRLWGGGGHVAWFVDGPAVCFAIFPCHWNRVLSGDGESRAEMNCVGRTSLTPYRWSIMCSLNSREPCSGYMYLWWSSSRAGLLLGDCSGPGEEHLLVLPLSFSVFGFASITRSLAPFLSSSVRSVRLEVCFYLAQGGKIGAILYNHHLNSNHTCLFIVYCIMYLCVC